MRLSVALSLSLVITATAAAQDFSGTYTIPGGNVPITLTLRQDRTGRITGTLNGQATFQVQARAQGNQFEGSATNQQGRLYIAGQLDPSTGGLQLVMAEVDASGTPQQQTARQMVAMRTSNAGVAAAPQAQPGSSIASTPQDRQITQLLLRSAWCSFSYSQTSGRTSTERVVYRQDGTGTLSSNTETYSSGQNGSYYGANQGGTAFRWRVQNGVLLATSDGVQWAQYPLQITQNSNGYPIITANGKEYSMCN